MQTTTLVAPDISCETCQRAIEGALGNVAGVSSYRVDIPSKQVEVTYDPEKVTQHHIEQVLDDIGFPITKERGRVAREVKTGGGKQRHLPSSLLERKQGDNSSQLNHGCSTFGLGTTVSFGRWGTTVKAALGVVIDMGHRKRKVPKSLGTNLIVCGPGADKSKVNPRAGMTRTRAHALAWLASILHSTGIP